MRCRGAWRNAIAAAVAAALVSAAQSVAFGQAQYPTPAGGQMVRGVAIMAPNGQTAPGGKVVAPVSSSNPLSVTCVSGCTSGPVTVTGGSITSNQGNPGTSAWPVVSKPTSGMGSVSSCTVGTSSAQCVAAAASRVTMAIDNESTTATIACNFGGTAALNAAGSWTIPPGDTRTWNGSFVPADAINCIASAASTPVTIEAY
jgi:hypothetical protein